MSTSNKGEDRSYPNKYYPSLARIEHTYQQTNEDYSRYLIVLILAFFDKIFHTFTQNTFQAAHAENFSSSPLA